MSKKLKGIIAALLCVALLAVVFVACSNNKSEESTTPASESSTPAEVSAEPETEAEEEDAGFTEIPIFEDVELAFINLSAVYFQPVPMSDGTKAEDSDIHLEADVSALKNDFGYELGSWIPYLTVDYDVIDADNNSVAKGTFMEMAASDGPHYGANIKLPDAGTYSLKLTIHSPADNDYLLHTDALTGPGAKSFDEAFTNGVLEYTFEGWNYEGPVEIPAN